MDRSIGVVEAIRTLVPDPFVSVFALVTLLGDAAVLLAVAFAYYWYSAGSLASGTRDGFALDRRRSAFVVACALGAFSLTTGLKAVFALPRPPMAVFDPGTFATLPFADSLRSIVESATSASEYGFPSGHAIGATVVYGAFALVADVGTRRVRWATAGTAIALVSLSRVVLGVHYLVDVLVGIAVGFGFLIATHRLARETNVRRAFGLAVGIGALAAIVAAGDAPRDALTLLGVSVGALSTWVLLGDRRPPTSRRDRLVTAAVGAVVAGVPGALTYVFDLALPVEFLAGVVVGTAIIATPRIATVGTRAVRVIRSDQNVSR